MCWHETSAMFVIYVFLFVNEVYMLCRCSLKYYIFFILINFINRKGPLLKVLTSIFVNLRSPTSGSECKPVIKQHGAETGSICITVSEALLFSRTKEIFPTVTGSVNSIQTVQMLPVKNWCYSAKCLTVCWVIVNYVKQ